MKAIFIFIAACVFTFPAAASLHCAGASWSVECEEATGHASAGVCRGYVDQKSGFSFYDCSEVDGTQATQNEPDERGFLPPANVKVYQIIDTGEPYGPPDPDQ